MTTERPTLTDFLLARIAEDEAAARSFDKELAREFGAPAASLLSSELTSAGSGHMDYPVLTIDSTRVLAECEAKRRIVQALDEAVNANSRDVGGLGVGSRLLGLLDAVHYLALPYADHPDYREEWRVEA